MVNNIDDDQPLMSQELSDDLWKDFAEAEDAHDKERQAKKDDFKKRLKGLIDIDKLYAYLNEDLDDGWDPEDIVEVKPTANKKTGYPTFTEYARIVVDINSPLYTKNEVKDCMFESFDNTHEIKGVDHYYVHQRTGMLGDDFYGHMLYPLTNGKYFKISYSC